MASYVVPQVEIHQLFSEVPNSITQQQQAFIFGPHYRLNRFNVEDDADTYIGDYENKPDEETFAIKGILDPEKLDKNYVKLYGRKAYVTLVDFTDTAAATVTTDDDGETRVAFEVPEELTKASAFVGKYLVLKSGDEETDYMQILSATLTNTTLTVVIDEALEVSSDSKTYTVTKIYEEQDVVEFPAKTSEVDGAVNQWSYADENITVEDLKVKIEDRSFVVETKKTEGLSNDGYGDVEEAELYVTYRELLTDKSETIHSLSSASDVLDILGAISPDNPLAQGVYNALLNAGGQTVRYMATPTDDLEGYQDVLQQAELTKDVYFLCPMTRDEDVIDLVQSHVNSMSEATTKRWRIAFVSMEIPDEVALYSSTNRTSGADWSAKVTVDASTKTATVTFNDDVGDCKFKKDITGNSNTLRANFKDLSGEYDTFKILKVVNNKTIRVDNTSGKLKATTTTEGIKVEIWHTYSNAEKATKIGDISSQLGDRRMYNIFPSGYNNNGVQYTGEFAAACVAGLVSSCLPQQPITNLQLVGIDDVPMVYQTFSLDDLNKMAAGGTFIIMQDSANDEVYVRHQISTAYEDNNLNTSELSITKNVDSISYSLDALLSPYIGKYNITPELLTTLRSVIQTGLTKLGSDSYGLYGAQLILSETEILLLEQDALLKDHVNCNIQLGVPYPFNHLVLKLFV